MNPLADNERVDVRRYCGYPAYGGAPAGTQSWRFFQVYGLLEFRLTNLSANELTVVRRYLGTLGMLEAAIPATAQNLDTDQAAIWTRNRTEATDRLRLFDEWRRRLCGFVGVQPGPALRAGTALIV